MSDEQHNLTPIIQELGEVTTLIKDLTEVKKKLEEQVKPALAGKGAIVAGDYQIEVTVTAGRKSLDTAAVKEYLQESGLSEDRFYKVSKPTSRMSIKRVKSL